MGGGAAVPAVGSYRVAVASVYPGSGLPEELQGALVVLGGRDLKPVLFHYDDALSREEDLLSAANNAHDTGLRRAPRHPQRPHRTQ